MSRPRVWPPRASKATYEAQQASISRSAVSVGIICHSGQLEPVIQLRKALRGDLNVTRRPSNGKQGGERNWRTRAGQKLPVGVPTRKAHSLVAT